MKWEDYIRINKEEVEEWSSTIRALINKGRKIGIPLDSITKLKEIDNLDKANQIMGKRYTLDNKIYHLSPEHVKHYEVLLQEINNSQMFASKTVEEKRRAALKNTIRDKNIQPR
tara:strand:- start:592 stop:933 length:342 start_codon:yes stop_codon:yes gene_type:complete